MWVEGVGRGRRVREVGRGFDIAGAGGEIWKVDREGCMSLTRKWRDLQTL